MTALRVLSKTVVHTSSESEVCSRQGAGSRCTDRAVPATVQETETESSIKQKIRVFRGHPLLFYCPCVPAPQTPPPRQAFLIVGRICS